MRIYLFAICVSHYFQWANCSFKTCFYTLKLLLCEGGAFSLRTYVWGLETDPVRWGHISCTSSKSVLGFFLNLLHAFHLVQSIWVAIKFFGSTCKFSTWCHRKSILVALAEDCQWSGNFLFAREACAQGRLSFPQGRETCEVPARLDLSTYFILIIWVFKGLFQKKTNKPGNFKSRHYCSTTFLRLRTF